MKLKLKKYRKICSKYPETEELVLDSDEISQYSKAAFGTYIVLKNNQGELCVTAEYEKLNQILEVVEV